MSRNIIKVGNREIKKMLSSQLLLMSIKNPHTQRIVDKSKVKEIVSYQLSRIKQEKYPNFLGVINIHVLSDSDSNLGTYYLVDGQHRYGAIIDLYNKYSHDLEVVVEIVKVDTKEELIHNYNLINKNTPLPEFPDEIDKTIPEEATRHFQEKYPDVWSEKSRAKRPNVRFNSFQETLGQVVKELRGNVDNAVGLIQEIEDLNKEISLWDRKEFKGVSEPMYQKAKQMDFFLGLLSYPSKGGGNGYEWGNILVKKKKTPPRSSPPPPSSSPPSPPTPRGKEEKVKPKKNVVIERKESVEGVKTKRKTAVPKKVKNDSWDIYIGREYGQAYCLVCDRTKIDSKCFQAGHIVSEKHGGPCTIDNILPVCGGCNQSVGPVNMREYVRKNYPSNLERFDKRAYRK